jgi:glycosyltransferase involved in cell wall biosynthesis
MKISVIIPTYNGANKIFRLLDSLSIQTLIPDQIIIVIDGSSDGTYELLLNYHNNFINSNNLKIIRQSNKGRSITRNTGANHASHELLIFIDDDMILDINFISAHFTHHSIYKNSLVTGPTVNLTSNSPFDKFRNMLSHRWSSEFNKYDNLPLPKNITYLTAANFSILKFNFVKLCGFDEQLKDAEDFDLAYRAILANYNIFYLHNAYALHSDNINFSNYIKRFRDYKSSHQILRNSKYELYKDHPILKIYDPSLSKKIIFSFFSNIFFIKLMENNLFLSLFPQFILNKLYDLILTSNAIVYPERVKL